MSPDPFGRALRDYHLGDREEPLVCREGGETLDHPIEQFYFGTFDPPEDHLYVESLDGPLLDMGAGVGQHARYFQERFEVVAIEVSEPLVETMRDRGVEDARQADMFDLRATFGRDRFRSALSHGTQVGLAGSIAGLRTFLNDLAYVTTPDATAVLDGYDPRQAATTDLLGYRPDPTPGLAYRVLQFEYEGDLGDPLLFRLFSPDRLCEATVGTDWAVDKLRLVPKERPDQWNAVLRKQ